MLDQAAASPRKIVGTIKRPISGKSATPETAPATAVVASATTPAPAAKAIAAPKKKPPRPPPRDRNALPGEVNVAVELAPEHRAHSSLAAIEARTALSLKVIEATRGVPEAPHETRQLRLTLAAAELFPEHTPNSLTWALETFLNTKPEQKQ
jgi:hypothetical protein